MNNNTADTASARLDARLAGMSTEQLLDVLAGLENVPYTPETGIVSARVCDLIVERLDIDAEVEKVVEDDDFNGTAYECIKRAVALKQRA